MLFAYALAFKVAYARCPGFALIEVSIALLILGIITSISMGQFAVLKRLRAEQITQRNIEYIVHSLGTYYLNKHGELPFPVQSNGSGFGYIPYKNMGIMERYTKDGYGNSLLYKLNNTLLYNSKINSRVLNNNALVNNNAVDKSLGTEYESDIKNDAVVFIIKTQDEKNIVWYSYKLFTHLFCNCVEYCNVSGAAVVYQSPLPRMFVD